MIAITFDHIHLRSLDPETAALFYVEHFGGTVVERGEAAGALRVTVAVGGTRINIDRVGPDTPTPPEPPFRGLEHVGFLVQDIDAAFAELTGRGVVFTAEPFERRPGLRIAFLQGPDDVMIELLERRTA